MKALIAVIALVASSAHATDLFYAANQANGQIVLTDAQANCPVGTHQYYATDAGGQVIPMGCWMYSDPWVMTRDNQGVNHRYMSTDFTPTEYVKAKIKRGKNDYQ